MKKYLILPMLALVFAGLFTTLVYAIPEPSPGFGQHIADMVPEHPQTMGAMFGDMVSMMAQGESCPCE
ncbi:MAG: hypothetical protein Q8P79_02920 [Nanoarchaeota archaeon]|nr:hypothetical protein [Nanoarchaeota archaeon]